MNLSNIFFLSGRGLFDFDLTFVVEEFLFLLLSWVVTFIFISPISKQINHRAAIINYNFHRSAIILTLGDEKISTCLNLLAKEIKELNRQSKLVKDYTQVSFDNEIVSIQKKNALILNKLKGDLSKKSAVFLSVLNIELITLTETFFVQKFQTNTI